LILLDTFLFDVLPSENISSAAIFIDVIYLLLLICQLILFLKCQWDPEWRAFIAFRANVVSDGSKVEHMKQWTHCLVLPPQSYDKEDGGIVPVSVVEPSEEGRQCCAAVINFRGLTYRCCVNASSVDVHADLEMESIWKSNDYLEDIDEEPEDRDGQNNHTDANAAVSQKPHFHRLHFPIDLPVSFYTSWTGHDSKGLTATLRVYGRNVTHIPLPSILSLLLQQLLQPLFLFQLFCVILWSVDEYWMYALFTLFSLVMFELTMAYNRWKGVKRLREEVAGGADEEEEHRQQIPLIECFRNNEWVSLSSRQLVVGDIISLASSSGQRHIMRHDHELGTSVPADLLLLSGRAVVDEAMLTGESVPQVKEAIECKSEKTLDVSQGHKQSVLFGGTVLMDHHAEDENGSSNRVNGTIPPPPNNGIVCFVLRTGYDTVQGSLLRSLAYRAETGGGNTGGGEGVNSTETFIFLGLLLLFALVSASTIIQNAWGDVTRNHFKLILHVIIIITSVIPPELPMELSLAVTTSLSELIKRCQVYCTEPVSRVALSI
jgi:magnesium-transporting ATPase (P-type)